MISLIVLFAIGVFLLCMKSGKNKEIYEFAKQVGGPKGYPILGNALDFIINMEGTLDTLVKYVKHCGDRFVFFFGPTPVLLINNTNDLEKVFTSVELIDKSDEYEWLEGWLGKGLVISTGSHWEHRRKLITPCFFFTILERFVEPINNHAEMLVDKLKENFSGKNEFQDITKFIAKCTLDIICDTSMGIEMNSQREPDCEYVNAVNRIGGLFYYRMVRPWLRPQIMWNLTASGREEAKLHKIINNFTDKVIAERKKKMMENGNLVEEEMGQKRKRPLLELLLEFQKDNPEAISDKWIREETSTFVFAGHETVAVAVGFCLYNIGNNPDCQKKLHTELDSIFSNDKTRPISLADLSNLKYLELCLKESMRLFPSGPLMGRKVKKAFHLDGNTVIPPGYIVYISPFLLHRNAKYFKQPDKFIPERFDLEDKEFSEDRAKSAFSYIPFSAGTRNCVGQKMAKMEAKIMLATILRRFKVISEKKIEDLEIRCELVMRVKDGLKVKLEER